MHSLCGRGPGNVFEVDVDVGSSRAANTVVGMVAPATKSLVISMGVALEGHSEAVRRLCPCANVPCLFCQTLMPTCEWSVAQASFRSGA